MFKAKVGVNANLVISTCMTVLTRTVDDELNRYAQGTNDMTVAIEQSDLLSAGLRKVGVDVSFIKIQGGGHKLEGPEIDGAARSFFDKHLLRNKTKSGSK